MNALFAGDLRNFDVAHTSGLGYRGAKSRFLVFSQSAAEKKWYSLRRSLKVYKIFPKVSLSLPFRTAVDTKRTTVGDRRVLNSKCPKRVGSFGSSTRFQMRKVVGN